MLGTKESSYANFTAFEGYSFVTNFKQISFNQSNVSDNELRFKFREFFDVYKVCFTVEENYLCSKERIKYFLNRKIKKFKDIEVLNYSFSCCFSIHVSGIGHRVKVSVCEIRNKKHRPISEGREGWK